MLINRNYFKRTKWKSLDLGGTITVMKNSLEGQQIWTWSRRNQQMSRSVNTDIAIWRTEKMKRNKQLQKNVGHQHMYNGSAKRRGKRKWAEKLLDEWYLKIQIRWKNINGRGLANSYSRMNHIQTCQNKNAERKILKTKGKPLMMYKKTPLRLIVDIRNSGSLKAVRCMQSAERNKTVN